MAATSLQHNAQRCFQIFFLHLLTLHCAVSSTTLFFMVWLKLTKCFRTVFVFLLPKLSIVQLRLGPRLQISKRSSYASLIPRKSLFCCWGFLWFKLHDTVFKVPFSMAWRVFKLWRNLGSSYFFAKNGVYPTFQQTTRTSQATFFFCFVSLFIVNYRNVVCLFGPLYLGCLFHP